FLQAEDGIRDRNVTGVQTCALPILNVFGGFKVQGKDQANAERLIKEARAVEKAGAIVCVLEGIPSELASVITKQLKIPTIGIGEIGRASCRERRKRAEISREVKTIA